MKCCKTCAHLLAPLTSNGQRRVMANGAYRCCVEVPQQDLPDCITKAHAFRTEPWRMHMTGDMGETCPFWAPLRK